MSMPFPTTAPSQLCHLSSPLPIGTPVISNNSLRFHHVLVSFSYRKGSFKSLKTQPYSFEFRVQFKALFLPHSPQARLLAVVAGAGGGGSTNALLPYSSCTSLLGLGSKKNRRGQGLPMDGSAGML